MRDDSHVCHGDSWVNRCGVGGNSLAQLWVFIAAPLVGDILAGLVYQVGITRAG